MAADANEVVELCNPVARCTLPDSLKNLWKRTFSPKASWHEICNRILVNGLLSLSILSASLFLASDLLACSCGTAFELPGTQRRWQDDEWQVARPTLDPTEPILIGIGDNLEDPILYGGETSMDYELRRLTDDSLCGADIVAIVPEDQPAPGQSLLLVSPELRERALEYEEQNGDAAGDQGQLPLLMSEARVPLEASLQILVGWERSWPAEFSGGGCDANALLEFQSQGYAKVQISSEEEVTFFATARVTLPNGEPYQHLASSHLRVVHKEEETALLGGAELSLTMPLTDPGDTPECITVELFNQKLESFYQEEFCPDEEQAKFAHYAVGAEVQATLAPLPDCPQFPGDDASGSEGCSLSSAPHSTSTGWWLVALAGVLSLLSARTKPARYADAKRSR